MQPPDPDADPTRFNPARRAAFEPDSEPTVQVNLDGGPTSVIDRNSAGPESQEWSSGGPGQGERADRTEWAEQVDPEPPVTYRDWRWVEEWRADAEKPAWAPGIAVAVFVAVLVAVALIVLTGGLRDSAWLAIVVNLVIGAGMAPALWLSRGLPVLRFLAAGAAVGLVGGWLWMLATFPGSPAA